MKCTNHVFILVKINAGLAANARIHHCEQCSRNLNEGDASLIGSCSIAAHISRYTAAKGKQHIISCKMVLN